MTTNVLPEVSDHRAERPGRGGPSITSEVLPRRTATVLAVPLLLVYVVPLLWMLITSVKSSGDVTRNPSGLLFQPSTDAYQAVAGDELWRSMWVSGQIAVAVTVGVMLLGVPAAFGLSRMHGRLRFVMIGLLLVFQMIPPAASLIPLYRLLAILNLVDTRQGLALIDIALFLPFAILLLRPFCLAVPRELGEAAMLDGAGPLRMLTYVVLPLVRNGAFVVAVMVFILTWGEFINAITFINDPQLQPLSALLSSQVTQFGVRWNNLMALAVITSLPLLVLYLLVHRRLQEGLTVGAGK
jgi:multiple sugar transport system permease protein